MGEIEQTTQSIYSEIREQIITARRQVKQVVNVGMVQVYWNIGKCIDGECAGKRVDYGQAVMQSLSKRLSVEFGKGYTVRNLQAMRQFYRAFPIAHALRAQLSWTHYRQLMRIPDEKARAYYMDECAASGWSSRELERQISTFAYQRTLENQVSSKMVSTKLQEAEMSVPYKKFIRDPYVLEFLNLKALPEYYEKDIEKGLIKHLKEFLLELGRGFSFVAEQKHIAIGEDDFYIDLVFYNYILKCFVLIDLKLGKLKHQDVGQMQMYVNYYAEELKNEGDNEPIGIILCAEKNDAVVKYTLGDDNRTHVYASRYMPYMPTEEELREELKLTIEPAEFE